MINKNKMLSYKHNRVVGFNSEEADSNGCRNAVAVDLSVRTSKLRALWSLRKSIYLLYWPSWQFQTSLKCFLGALTRFTWKNDLTSNLSLWALSHRTGVINKRFACRRSISFGEMVWRWVSMSPAPNLGPAGILGPPPAVCCLLNTCTKLVMTIIINIRNVYRKFSFIKGSVTVSQSYLITKSFMYYLCLHRHWYFYVVFFFLFYYYSTL